VVGYYHFSSFSANTGNCLSDDNSTRSTALMDAGGGLNPAKVGRVRVEPPRLLKMKTGGGGWGLWGEVSVGSPSDTVTDCAFAVVKSGEKDWAGQDANGGAGYQHDPPHVIRFVVFT